MSGEQQTVYKPDGATLRAYLRDQAPVVIIRGPIGSGTSSASCAKIWTQAVNQAPGTTTGVRRSRWAVVRNTYQELTETTIKTWLTWFPEDVYGDMRRSKPMQHVIRLDGFELEVTFLALDQEEDVKKLRSYELTGVWFNELEFIPKEIFDEAQSRCGRFPPVMDGGPTWHGVIGDMNAPAEDHWLPKLMGEVPPPPDCPEEELAQYEKPPGWSYHIQPPGLRELVGADGRTVIGYEDSPLAENQRWLVPGYYLGLIKGKTKQWIDSRVMNRIIPRVEGRPVWPMFKPETHVAKQPLRYRPDYPLSIGLDFGRRPAAVFGQQVNQRWGILDELVATDVGARVFSRMLIRRLVTQFPGLFTSDDPGALSLEQLCRDGRLVLWGDPKGRDKTQADENTAYDIYRDAGLMVRPAPIPNNHVQTRIETVESVLNALADGAPRFLLDSRCRELNMAMAGGYHFSKNSIKAGDPEPEKDRWSNIADALQYLLIGGGEGKVLTGRAPGMTGSPKPQRYHRPLNLRRVGR
jgi:hypothetical protein